MAFHLITESFDWLPVAWAGIYLAVTIAAVSFVLWTSEVRERTRIRDSVRENMIPEW